VYNSNNEQFDIKVEGIKMSVEIEGVKGYEYQYMATVYISLLYIDKESVEIYVEDTEDAKVNFQEDGSKIKLYIQAKKHNASISFEDVCLWLGHFGEHQSNNFLLSRVAEENCYAVFFSNGRCEDKASKFICNQDFESGNNSSFNSQYVEDFKYFLSNQYKDDTSLSAERKKCIDNFLEAYSNYHIKSLLNKVCLSEQISFDTLRYKTAELLNKKFVVRAVSINHVIKLLDECVRKGRDTSKDIVPGIRAILSNFSQKILPDSLDYIEVPNQKKYESLLKKNNALLLTGVPFSGKTSLAKAIAQSFAQQGYEVKQTSELDGDNGALSFLNSYTDDKRLMILEDPFGSVQLKQDKVECVQKIRKLIMEKISFDRKIIITTRKDILLAAFDVMTVDDCSIDNNRWIDLTINNIDFAHAFWNKLYGCEIESSKYFEKIKNWIEAKEAGVFLEIGEISNLKKLHPSIDELKKLSIDIVIINARISSKIIMDKVKMGGADSVKAFLSLGFCCNTIKSVFLDDLSYVLSSDKETPALIQRRKDSVRCISTGGGITTVPRFPQYIQKYKIDPNILRWLQQFEKQGYIFRNKLSKEIYFAHPIFCFASKLLLLDELKNQWECDEAILLGTHAIGALNKNVNLCALDMLWYCVENKCNYQENILSIILNSLNSIFPATKDKAVILLEKCFQELHSEQQDILVKAIKDYKFDKYLLWNNNEPFINQNDQIELEWSFESIFGTECSIGIEEIKKIKSKQQTSPQLVYEVLNSKIADDLPLGFLNISLMYDESIIREKAIYLIFKNYGDHVNNISSKYLSDFDNCNVIFALFRGALESWFTYTKQDRHIIMDYFLLHLQRVSVAMHAKRFLETFGDSYHAQSLNWKNYTEEQTNELWKVWCVVFTKFLLKFPPQYINMDEAHMQHTMGQVVKYINDQDQGLLLNLFSAWNTWLNKCRCPNDYGMCVMEYLLKYIPAMSIGREQLFCEMLTIENTSIITSHIKYVIDNWECTTQREKQKVNELFSSNRYDLIWITAVVLTRRSVPVEIQNWIFKDNIFCKSISEFVKILRDFHLLEYCLNVYCGYPQPLCWNGYHHSNIKVWDAVIGEVLREDILNQSFEIALREFIDCEYNYERRFTKSSSEIWNSLLPNPRKRERAFSWLIKVSSTQTQTNKALWDKYFDSCCNDEKEAAYIKIANFIEALEYNQDGDAGILNLFEKASIFEHIYPLLESDMVIKNLCELALTLHYRTRKFIEESIRQEELQKDRDMFEMGIRVLYDKNPPRMQLTNVIVKSTAEKIQLSSKSLNDILEKRRCDLIDAANEKEKQLDDHYELKNWNS